MDRFKDQDEALRFWRWQKGYAPDVFANTEEALEFFRWTDNTAKATQGSPSITSVTSSPLELSATSVTPASSQIKSIPRSTLPSIQSIASSSFGAQSNLSLKTSKNQLGVGQPTPSALLPSFNLTTQAVSQYGNATASTRPGSAHIGETSASVGRHFMNAMLESRSHTEKKKGRNGRDTSHLHGKSGKIIKFGADKRILYLPSQFLLTSPDIVINKRVAELLCSMCEQRQYVAYPSISQGAPPIEIQTEIVNAFLAKAPPIDLRKYFFTWCTVDGYTHRLKPQLSSALADGNALSSWYLRGSQAYIVPSSDVDLDESFETEFLTQYRSKLLGKRARNWPDSSDSEPDDSADHAECPKCQRKMTAAELSGHETLCSGRAPRIARRLERSPPAPAKGKTTGTNARRTRHPGKDRAAPKAVSLSPDSPSEKSKSNTELSDGNQANQRPPRNGSTHLAEGGRSSPRPAPIASPAISVDSQRLLSPPYDPNWTLHQPYPSPPIFGPSPPERPVIPLPEPVVSLLPEDVFDMTRYGTVSPPNRPPEVSTVVRVRQPIHVMDDWADISSAIPPFGAPELALLGEAPNLETHTTLAASDLTMSSHDSTHIESTQQTVLRSPISTPVAVRRARGAASAQQRQLLRLQEDRQTATAGTDHPDGPREQVIPLPSAARTRSARPAATRAAAPRAAATRAAAPRAVASRAAATRAASAQMTLMEDGTGPSRVPGPISSSGRRTTKLA